MRVHACLNSTSLRIYSLESSLFFFLNDPATPEISPLPLPAALPICVEQDVPLRRAPTSAGPPVRVVVDRGHRCVRGEDDHVGVRRHPALRRLLDDDGPRRDQDRKSTRLNSSHGYIPHAVFCLQKKKQCPITICCTSSSPRLPISMSFWSPRASSTWWTAPAES